MNRSERRRMGRQARIAAPGSPAHAVAVPMDALQRVIALHQAGRNEKAEKLLVRLDRQYPDNAAIAQLLGLARLERGAVHDAVALFERSLKADARQPHVHNNLGTAHLRLGDAPAAEQCFLKALHLQPDYVDARFNLGVVIARRGRHEEAADHFRKILETHPGHTAALNAFGDALRQCERFDEAVEALRAALRLQPNYADAHHNLGLALAARADHQAALEAYANAQRQGLDQFQVHHNKANAHAELGQAAEAIAGYRAAIARQPDYVEAHINLNNLLWENGQTAEYLSSYRDVLERHPEAARLYAPFSAALLRQDRFAEADEVISRGLVHAPGDPAILYAAAQSRDSQGDLDEALDLFESCVRLAPEQPEYRIGIGRFLLKASEVKKALEHLDMAVKQSPFHQRALAYQSLAWRLLGDSRDEWLNDYESFVRPYELPVPEGYDSLPGFLQELTQTLERLHTATNHPVDQTLRNGTQTTGALFKRRDSVILSLQESLRKCIADYADCLPGDPSHPLVARRAAEFDFAGSWSVRLKRSGFHTIHVHPMGWLSSAFYVRVPEVVQRDEDKAGWIKFGQPDIDVGEATHARRYVQPHEGMLVLFPSYMWHGTVPFETDDVRMTVAFDVAPVPDPVRDGPG